VATSLDGVSPGLIFLAPAFGPGQLGPFIVDNHGEPVWIRARSDTTIHNFRAQRFAGRPVLTWWEGTVTKQGFGQGQYVIADSSYRVIRRLSAANGYQGDLHEFTITTRGSALVSVYNQISADFSAYGGATDGAVLEGIVQEIDIRTDKLLFEWHSADHVGLDESYISPGSPAWDYFHLNSIGVLSDGNLILSARHTSAAYKIDRRTGTVIWRLCGRKSDFAMGPGTTFAYQHDVRGHGANLVSVFDDGAQQVGVEAETTSRAIIVALDSNAMTAELVRADANPQGSLTYAMGNTQVLPDGNVFVGWGTVPSVSEFSVDGELLFDAHMAAGNAGYRAYRLPWKGHPLGRPAILGSGNTDGTFDVFASWNGATEVTSWRLLGGKHPNVLHPLRVVPRSGFETVVAMAAAPAYVAVAALDAHGNTLGTSKTLATAGL